MLQGSRVEPVASQEGARKTKQAADLAGAEFVVAENLEHIREQRNAGAEEDQSDYIEWARSFLDVIRQMQVDQDQADNPDRNVEEEDDSPVEVSHDESARHRPQHGSDQGWYRYETHD